MQLSRFVCRSYWLLKQCIFESLICGGIYGNCSAVGHLAHKYMAIFVNIDGHRTWGRFKTAGRMRCLQNARTPVVRLSERLSINSFGQSVRVVARAVHWRVFSVNTSFGGCHAEAIFIYPQKSIWSPPRCLGCICDERVMVVEPVADRISRT